MAKYVFVACVLAACFWSTETVGQDHLNKKVKRYIYYHHNFFCEDVSSCTDIQVILAEQKEMETENQALKQTISEIQTDLIQLEAKMNITTLPTTTTTTLPTTTFTTTTPTTTALNPCDEGWQHFNGHCYWINPFPQDKFETWENAFADCRDRGAYLVEINDDAEREFLYDKYFLRDYEWYHIWIGATFKADLGIMGQVTYDQSGQVVPKYYWPSDQPNDGDGQYKCTAMYQACEVKLYLGKCSKPLPYMCEKP